LSSCPSGFEENTAGTACRLIQTPVTNNTTTTTSSSSSDSGYSLAYFPFFGAALFLLIISIVGCAKDSRSLIVTVFIALLGIVEFFFYIVQMFHAYRADETNILYITALSLIGLII